MITFTFDMYLTLGLAIILYLLGSGIKAKVGFLQKYYIIHIGNSDELMSWLGLLFAVLTVLNNCKGIK